jgi:hypothetical protein
MADPATIAIETPGENPDLPKINLPPAPMPEADVVLADKPVEPLEIEIRPASNEVSQHPNDIERIMLKAYEDQAIVGESQAIVKRTSDGGYLRISENANHAQMVADQEQELSLLSSPEQEATELEAEGAAPPAEEEDGGFWRGVQNFFAGMPHGLVEGQAHFNDLFPIGEWVTPDGRTLTTVRDGLNYLGELTGLDAKPPPKPEGSLAAEFGAGFAMFIPTMIPFVKALRMAGSGPVIADIVSGALADVATSGKTEADNFISMFKMLPEEAEVLGIPFGEFSASTAAALEDFINAAPGSLIDTNFRARLFAGIPGIVFGSALTPALKGIGKLAVLAKDSGAGQYMIKVAKEVKEFFADTSGSVKLPPTADEIAKARSDTRQGADIVAERLNVIVPESERVIGGRYKAGRPDGRPWSSLTDDELAKRGPGFKGTDADLDRIWQEVLGEVSEAARDAVERTGATWNAFPAAEWDKALRLPTRAQLWYELSGEAFLRRLPGLSEQEHMMFLDLIGATSARAQPDQNLERGLAVLSQRLRGVPVDVDVAIRSTVGDALKRAGKAVSSALANKTGMFSDTLGLVAGKPVRYPISVNDVWVGKAFGIDDADLSANQALHEVFGKYMNKMRDNVNASGGHAFDHQSWNLQARQWVQMRATEKGIDTSLGKTIQGSDYAGEMDAVVKKLEAAGIKVPGGIMTRDILMDPRFADALRPQTPGFRLAPKATVEFGTLLTPFGHKAAKLYHAARVAGDEITQREYRSILTSSMYATARGKPTLWEKVVRTATGETRSVTRIYSPTADDTFAISGTFEGAASPNIRVPLKDMTPDQIAYFNAVMGKGLKQKAMAAAEIRPLNSKNAPLPDGAVMTASIRFDLDGPVPEKLLTDMTEVLGEGFEVSATRNPDGMLVDVNPRFGDAGPEGPGSAAVDAAMAMLASRYGARNVEAFASSFKSDFGKHYIEDPGDATVWNKIIKDALKEWKNGAATEIDNLAQGAVSKRDIRAFLSGKLDKLPIDRSALPRGVSGVSVRGKASTIRKRLSGRLSDHHEQSKAAGAVGSELNRELGKAIPKWEARARKLGAPLNPPKGGS